MKLGFVAVASAAAVAAPTAVAQSAFDDLAAFEAAAGGSAVVDDFVAYGVIDLALGANNFFNGYSVVLSGSGTGGATINSASNFVFTLGADLESITFNFDQPITGFGADWLNSFVSNGLTVTVNGNAFNVEDTVNEPSFEFVGVAGGGAFNGPSITVTNPGQGTEFAAISNLYYVPVPAPASAALLGLGGLAAARRRR